ncbi:MAG: hypothetical protein H6738_15435 [Alphaproteobacteria bacterium]|nr:hypothetical protein [Alphaproteobacteria bacterium]MCB9698171.1 hypothetical protein [Alphaproteobacteria bacterium]
MSKRIRNYRTGDRAEDLGVFLLRAFCAVAPIPRQEDFGLADAVATLLRGEDRFWYAEDTFLVQFKSRSVPSMKLDGPVFQRWLEQDLSVFVARVDLLDSSIELFTLGTALFACDLHEARGLHAWLHGGSEGLVDGVLHITLDKPILRWTVASTEDRDFTERTYASVKAWLQLERWNRRYFKAGVARRITWETGAAPEAAEVVHSWTPAHGREALADIEPLVHLLGLHARNHPELWTKVHAVEQALRGSDDRGMFAGLRPFMQQSDAMTRLAEVIEAHPTADAVVTVQVLRLDEVGANFWIYTYGRGGPGGGTRHHGSWEELEAKGFDHEVEKLEDGERISLGLDRYFASTPIPHEIIDGPQQAPTLERGDHSPFYFLRKLPQGDAENRSGPIEEAPDEAV